MTDRAVQDLLKQLLRRVPEVDHTEGREIEAFVRDGHLLDPAEPFLGGMSETWIEGVSKGVVITDRRLFRYRGARLVLEIDLGYVTSIAARRMWYPLNPGGIGSLGSVEIVRLRFNCGGVNPVVRLRLQGWSSRMLAILSPLFTRFAASTTIRTTLPGL